MNKSAFFKIAVLAIIFFTFTACGNDDNEIPPHMPSPGFVDAPKEFYGKMNGTYDAIVRVYHSVPGKDDERIDSAHCKVSFTSDDDLEYPYYGQIIVEKMPTRLMTRFFYKDDPNYGTDPYRSSVNQSEDSLSFSMSYNLFVWSSDYEYMYGLPKPTFGPMNYEIIEDESLTGTDINAWGQKYLLGVPAGRASDYLTADGKKVPIQVSFNGRSWLMDTYSVSKKKKEIGNGRYFADGVLLYPSVVMIDGIRHTIDNSYELFIRIYEDKTEND